MIEDDSENICRISVTKKVLKIKLPVLILILTLTLATLTINPVNADESLIWSETSNPSSVDDIAFDVAVDSTGLYVVGIDRSPGKGQWRIEKRALTDGSLIWSETSNPSGDIDWPHGVAVDSTGLYIVGSDSSPGDAQWRIEKWERVSTIPTTPEPTTPTKKEPTETGGFSILDILENPTNLMLIIIAILILVLIAMFARRGRPTASKREEKSTVYCVNCGAPMKSGSNFCDKCGTRIE